MAEKGVNAEVLSAYDFGRVGITRDSHKPEVGLRLESYTEIFSDFDPRPYSQRALSQDFLDELRRATSEIEEESFKLNLLMPAAQRNIPEELIIKKRLNEHFRKHTAMQDKEHRKIIKTGVIMILFGVLLMAGATLVLHYSQGNWLYSFLRVLLEPAGWFMIWEGMYLAIFVNRERKPEFEFYKKGNKAEIRFSDG